MFSGKKGCLFICGILVILICILMSSFFIPFIRMILGIITPPSKNEYYDMINQNFEINARAENCEILSSRYSKNIDQSFSVHMFVDDELAEQIRGLCSIQESEKDRLIENYLIPLVGHTNLVDDYKLNEIASRANTGIYALDNKEHYHVLIIDEHELYYLYW